MVLGRAHTPSKAQQSFFALTHQPLSHVHSNCGFMNWRGEEICKLLVVQTSAEIVSQIQGETLSIFASYPASCI